MSSARYSEEWLANRLAKQGAESRATVAGEEDPRPGRKYTFTIFGEAEPAGSKKALVPLNKKTKEPYRRPGGGIVVSVVDANKHAERWKKYVAKIAREEYSGPLFDCPLKVSFTFYRPRPASHFGKLGLNKEGRSNPFPDVAPDVLKLSRGIEDALQGICYVNDSRIVDEDLKKRWGEPARVEITIEELELYPNDEQPELFDAPAPWDKIQHKGEI